MEALKQLVGSRSSVPNEHVDPQPNPQTPAPTPTSIPAPSPNPNQVPKEQVYPRFDSLAKLWATFNDELTLLQARDATLAELRTYTESYVPTLRSDDLVAARSARRADSTLGQEAALPAAEPSEVEAVLKAAGPSEAVADGEVAEAVGEGDEQAASASLELEGFCPVTLAQRSGLLLLARPGLLVRYRSRYYGCVDQPSMAAFIAAPDAYLSSVLEAAKRAPELIHMLRLQEHFPAASIQEIMRQGTQTVGGGRSSMPQARHFQDSCQQTPTHPVEKHIDPSYEWNEWALRRRALDLANLRKKATHSTQTVASSMRREAETQVYLPKDDGTMTGVSTSTAVPITRNYIAGLRGAPDAKMAMVNLTVDPQVAMGKYR